MRAFLAFELPPDVLAYLTGLITKMASVVRDVKWVRNEGIHITVKFLGEIEEEKARLMEQILAPVGEEFAPFKVTLDCIDAFPDKRRARVIVVRLKEGADIMRTIFSGLEAGLVTVGIERETREFTPHLTLGRRRSPAPFPGDPPLIEKRGFDVSDLTLFKSTLTPAGAIYTPVWKITLGGAS